MRARVPRRKLIFLKLIMPNLNPKKECASYQMHTLSCELNLDYTTQISVAVIVGTPVKVSSNTADFVALPSAS